jgi:peptidoglycan hydrolase-like amidase
MRSNNYVAAMNATAGEIVTYDGKGVKTWYFSASNGQTKSYTQYCQEA